MQPASQMFAIFITNFHASYNTYILHSRLMMQLSNTYITDMENKLGGINLPSFPQDNTGVARNQNSKLLIFAVLY